MTNPQTSSTVQSHVGQQTGRRNGKEQKDAAPNKGAFFALHSDWGNGYIYPPELDEPDEGAYFGLHTDWGNRDV